MCSAWDKLAPAAVISCRPHCLWQMCWQVLQRVLWYGASTSSAVVIVLDWVHWLYFSMSSPAPFSNSYSTTSMVCSHELYWSVQDLHDSNH